MGGTDAATAVAVKILVEQHVIAEVYDSISRKLSGNQIGPRQFEFPPNNPESDSAGAYLTLKSMPSTRKMKGCLS